MVIVGFLLLAIGLLVLALGTFPHSNTVGLITALAGVLLVALGVLDIDTADALVRR